MTHVSLKTLAGALLASAIAGSADAGDAIDIQVSVVSSARPDAIVIQEENSLNSVPLQRVPNQTLFVGTVLRPSAAALTSAGATASPYRLVGSWGDDKEDIFLAFDAQTPAVIKLVVMHQSVGQDLATLDGIDALGTDLQSVLAKYFRARAFHRKWRYQLKLPLHQIAIRSAKIWFDAAVNLVKRAQSHYRMDADVRRIFEDYEALAATDKSFRQRYRRYVNTGYTQGTLDQVTAAKYRFVGEIPKLVLARRYQEAVEMNRTALEALMNEEPEVKRVVAVHQGVNLELLRDNAAFLSKRLGEGG